MKLSDYVIQFVESFADSMFLLSGGGIMHLVDSVGKSKKLHVVCCHHEQAAATAAEGYGRIKNTPGVVLVTTGPGGTNALTGVAGAWLDSIPMFVISGQVKTDNITPRINGKPTMRALGFQELNVIDMAKCITKYAVTIEEPQMIRYCLERALYLTTHGRPGPVWVEIPLDIQATEIDPKRLPRFQPRPDFEFESYHVPKKILIKTLRDAKRPLMLVGNGIKLGGAIEETWEFVKKTKINVVSTMFTADDIITYEYEHYLGRQGIPGNPIANWAIDNCDVLLVVGDRLQLTQTSYDYKNFATQATRIMVDIDPAELSKKTVQIDFPVLSDAKYFLREMNKVVPRLADWKVTQAPPNSARYKGKKNYVNLYSFLDKLSHHTKGRHVTTTDGLASMASHQWLRVPRGTRFLTNAGLGQMGSGLPLAIGAAVGSKKDVICLEGDGSIMLNLQELQTMKHHNLPIKLFLVNNNGYFSIRNTHKNYFKRIFAADPSSGVSFPDFQKLIRAFGLSYKRIAIDKDLGKVMRVMGEKGPVVCELIVDPDQPTPPKWSAGMYRGKRMPS